jgi:prefoldin subunit 5
MDKETKALIDFYDNKIKELEKQNKEKQDKLKKIEEYITSYESISTIQGLNDTKENKNLDKNTMVEMTNRYLKVNKYVDDLIQAGLVEKIEE